MTEREEALEEAAMVAEQLAAELCRLQGAGDRRVQIGSHLETCATIAKAIRALASSPPPKGGDYERLKLRSALEIAGDQFEFYAKEHRQKAHTSRGNGLEAAAVAADEKAATNERFANLCRNALAPDEKLERPPAPTEHGNEGHDQ